MELKVLNFAKNSYVRRLIAGKFFNVTRNAIHLMIAITTFFIFSATHVTAQDKLDTIKGSKILNSAALNELYIKGLSLVESGDCESAVDYLEVTISQSARTINLLNLAIEAYTSRSRDEQKALSRFAPKMPGFDLIYVIGLGSEVEGLQGLTTEATLKLAECYVEQERYDDAVLALGAYLKAVPVIKGMSPKVEPKPEQWSRALTLLLSIPQSR